ncbi:MAG: hypothetical protein ACFCVE_13335 [Phycisphaerae bacterium]
MDKGTREFQIAASGYLVGQIIALITLRLAHAYVLGYPPDAAMGLLVLLVSGGHLLLAAIVYFCLRRFLSRRGQVMSAGFLLGLSSIATVILVIAALFGPEPI